MRLLFLSPHFPPPIRLFCRALRERGVVVLGLGDAPREVLGADVLDHLTDYTFVPDLHRVGEAVEAARSLAARHGPIDAVESHNEYWLGLEAHLREALGVRGPTPTEVAGWQSKASMADRFERAGLRPPRTSPVTSAADARAFARAHGFPVLLKPEIGVGAGGVTIVEDEAALEAHLAEGVRPSVAQEVIRGALVTYDGLVDASGRVIFAASLRYAAGVMEFVRDGLDVVYHVRRAIPARVEEVGRRVLAAFDVRGRFFHIELFELPDGDVRPLEINVRPPGGWSLDLMDFAADVDLYRLWAGVVAGDEVAPVHGPHRYFAAHVGRRAWRRYRRSVEQVARELGPALVGVPEVPEAIGAAMGSPIFLVRHEDEATLLEMAARILEPG